MHCLASAMASVYCLREAWDADRLEKKTWFLGSSLMADV